MWETDRLLAFKPSTEWPPGTEFTVTLDPAQLAKEVRLKDKPSHTFHISTLTPKWSSLEFYTNPKAPEEHEITAELSFTHPMALSEVEKHIVDDAEKELYDKVLATRKEYTTILRKNCVSL